MKKIKKQKPALKYIHRKYPENFSYNDGLYGSVLFDPEFFRLHPEISLFRPFNESPVRKSESYKK